MMCSIEELGSSTDFYPDAAEDGIYILSDNPEYKDAPGGSDAIALLGLRDADFEYEVTSNRVDCFGVLGIAREAAASFRKPFVPPVVTESGNDEKTEDYISVEIQAPDLCSRYVARVVKNIKIEPSPEWMQRRLAASGIRPINNIVDITNYVMQEYAQPMHAYDLDTIAGHKIVVKRAEDGEKFQTLDGQERELDSSILMICDGEKSVGLAGIMGGENSKITDDVKTMLFEAACFDGVSVRRTARKIGERTEASSRFEKGLNPVNAEKALKRALQLIEMLGCGEVVNTIIDENHSEYVPERLKHDYKWVNEHLGSDISENEQIEILKKLGFGYENGEIIVPPTRIDMHRACDVAEEVARIYGYNRIPSTIPKLSSQGKRTPEQIFEDKVISLALALGFYEVMTYSFISPKDYELLRMDEKSRKSVVLRRPLGEDTSVMRTSALTSMMEVVRRNWSNRNLEGRFFEIAREYFPTGENQLPVERDVLCYALYGSGEDFFTAKGVAEEVMAKLGLKNVVYTAEKNNPTFHPGRCAKVTVNGELIGYVGQLHPEAAANFGVNTEVYCATLSMEVMFNNANGDVKYTALPKFPSTYRDLSLVCNEDVPSGDIVAVIEKTAKHLETVRLFDMYKGEQVPAGMKSLSYKLILRKKDATLTDDEADAVVAKVLKALEDIGVTLR